LVDLTHSHWSRVAIVAHDQTMFAYRRCLLYLFAASQPHSVCTLACRPPSFLRSSQFVSHQFDLQLPFKIITNFALLTLSTLSTLFALFDLLFARPQPTLDRHLKLILIETKTTTNTARSLSSFLLVDR
jgi:hypothetical protein